MRGGLMVLAGAGALAFMAPAARAQPAPAASVQEAGEACGKHLSRPVLAEWNALGGQAGSLGCPTEDETPGSTSPQGSKADEADFTGGMILHHVTGPRAGQTFAVTGCIWRLYFQYGGPSGWLGQPVAEPDNFPDGQRQAFEGGRITYERATNDCSAEPTAGSAAAAAPLPTAPTSPLDAYADAAGASRVSVSTAGVEKLAESAGDERTGPQARVFDQPGPGMSRLRLFWSQARGDFVSTATDEGERRALASGDEFEATQGYVWKDPHDGAIALQQFRDPTSGRHWLTAGADEAAKAKAAGYVFVRIEGYAPPP